MSDLPDSPPVQQPSVDTKAPGVETLAEPELEVKQFETETEFYQGEVLLNSQVKHGTGTLVSKIDLTKFVGGFAGNKKSGDGQMEWIDPNSKYTDYMGNFVDDDFSGMGILAYRDGRIFKGDFAHGVPIEGLLTYQNGDEYCGCLLKDKREGYGVLKYAQTGNTYSGEFVQDAKHGKGVETKFEAGEPVSVNGVFEQDILKMGQWKRGTETYFGEFNSVQQFHGKGVYSYSDGEMYQGKFENGLRHGWGTYKDLSSVYEGNWVDGRKDQGTLKYFESNEIYIGTFNEEGQKDCGVMSYPNGDEYSGAFLNGAREIGLMTFKETGNVYKGYFENGLMHGSGELMNAEGDVYKGEMEFGVKCGQGSLVLKDDGGIYVGEFKDDVMHGNGCFTMPDGSEYIGEFINGVQHGDGMITTVAGVQIFGRWVEGKYQQLEYNVQLEDVENLPEPKEDASEQDGAPDASEQPEPEQADPAVEQEADWGSKLQDAEEPK